MDIYDLFIASEIQKSTGGTTGGYTKEEIDEMLANKVSKDDIITNEMIDVITTN